MFYESLALCRAVYFCAPAYVNEQLVLYTCKINFAILKYNFNCINISIKSFLIDVGITHYQSIKCIQNLFTYIARRLSLAVQTLSYSVLYLEM